jgi:hypothetical protein
MKPSRSAIDIVANSQVQELRQETACKDGILAETGGLEQRRPATGREEMFAKCPKCGASVNALAPDAAERCPSCGVIFAKFLQAQQGLPARAAAPARTTAPAADAHEGERPALLERLLYVPARVESVNFYARCIAYAVFFIWGWRLYAIDITDPDGAFMHLIILPIHEAGHMIFIPFGRFMTIAGGSLLQVLVPLVLTASFIIGFGGSRRDNFAASLMLWWAGVAVIDLAPYIWDAYDPKLTLLGGGTGAEKDGHDWQNMLGDFNLIRKAHLIGNIAHKSGALVMVIALAWGATLLWRQYKNKDSELLEEQE